MNWDLDKANIQLEFLIFVHVTIISYLILTLSQQLKNKLKKNRQSCNIKKLMGINYRNVRI